jgi:hypothetical protein
MLRAAAAHQQRAAAAVAKTIKSAITGTSKFCSRSKHHVLTCMGQTQLQKMVAHEMLEPMQHRLTHSVTNKQQTPSYHLLVDATAALAGAAAAAALQNDRLGDACGLLQSKASQDLTAHFTSAQACITKFLHQLHAASASRHKHCITGTVPTPLLPYNHTFAHAI